MTAKVGDSALPRKPISDYAPNRHFPFSTIRPEEYKENVKAGKPILRLWVKDPTRVDLGECLFGPMVQYIPRMIHPNHLTFLTLICSFILFALGSAVPPTADVYTKAKLCVLCSIANFISMSLDCIDGMHARATKQTSHLGGLLDHWFDSIIAPLNAAAMAVAFDTADTTVEIGLAAIAAVFHVQLLIFHYYNEFPRITGVEAQLTVILSFNVAAIGYVTGYELAIRRMSDVMSYLTAIGFLFFTVRFGVRYSLTMWIQFCIFMTPLLTFCAFHHIGYLSTVEFAMLCTCLSNRINGGLVLHTILRKRIGWVDPIYLFCCVAIALENLYFKAHIFDFFSNVSGGVFDSTLAPLQHKIHFTAWLFMIVGTYRSIFELLPQIPNVLALDKKKS